jgi:hypothetical protein
MYGVMERRHGGLVHFDLGEERRQRFGYVAWLSTHRNDNSFRAPFFSGLSVELARSLLAYFLQHLLIFAGVFEAFLREFENLYVKFFVSFFFIGFVGAAVTLMVLSNFNTRKRKPETNATAAVDDDGVSTDPAIATNADTTRILTPSWSGSSSPTTSMRADEKAAEEQIEMNVASEAPDGPAGDTDGGSDVLPPRSPSNDVPLSDSGPRSAPQKAPRVGDEDTPLVPLFAAAVNVFLLGVFFESRVLYIVFATCICAIPTVTLAVTARFWRAIPNNNTHDVITVSTVYLSLDTPFFSRLLTFVAQLSVLAMVYATILDDDEYEDVSMQRENWLFFITSILLAGPQLVIMLPKGLAEEQESNSFVHDLSIFAKLADSRELALVPEGVATVRLNDSNRYRIIRMSEALLLSVGGSKRIWMAFYMATVGEIFLPLVMVILPIPILTFSKTPLDFLLNSMAFTFVATVDNLQVKETYRMEPDEVLAAWKNQSTITSEEEQALPVTSGAEDDLDEPQSHAEEPFSEEFEGFG